MANLSITFGDKLVGWANSGGHFYLANGEPFYTVISKSTGEERPATLRDARKVGAYPSVTGIIRTAAAPGLEKWKRNSLLLAALTLPRLEGESEEHWLARVEQDWQEEGRAAAERGTAIHAAIEKHYRGEIPDEDLWPWVQAVKAEIADRCGAQHWHAERSFACATHAFGGKTDLHSGEWVIDAKGKPGLDPKDLTLFDEHCMQLAAYREGLNIPGARCGILFVSRTEPKAILVEAKESELERGWNMFLALLSFWQAKNNYAPNR